MRTDKGQSAKSKAIILGCRKRKPPTPPVDPKAIPRELTQLNRWVGWQWKWNAKARKWDKPPINTRTGRPCSSTDSATWCSFDQALEAQGAGTMDGIGFVLGLADDGTTFAGIDLDDCRDARTGKLIDLARDIIKSMDTYSERSPTGTGVKLLCIGRLPKGALNKSKDGTVEMYDSGRYFTITGQRVPKTTKCVETRQEQMRAIHV